MSWGWGHWLAAVGLLATMLGPVRASEVPDGPRLFQRHCAVCHGETGEGGVGVPLALPAFQASVSDAYLRRTIRLGRPGRVMPSFAYLSDAEVNAIITYIRSWLDVPRPAFSEARVEGDVEHGRVLFAERCAACHGSNGEGGTGTGVTFSRPRDLPIIAPALNNPGFLAAASDLMIKATLMRGRAGTPMVSFLEQGLSESDIDDLVAFIRGFEKSAPQLRSHLKAVSHEAAVLVYESPYSVAETVEAVKRAVIGKNFRLIRTQRLESGLFPEAEQDPQQVIVYFCNFNFLNEALKIDPRVGLFLPCRVTVVEQDGVVKVMSINPKRLSSLFNNNALDEACNQMYQVYTDILEEATL
ncbi:c-type cytochrome [Thiohalobacter sp. IOR34]|uniref:c-type cytochrome n=1 Tax=Thiohalobacter sp. IOR34 TaxID=3057176 RepID=UPI0025B256DC|nr:c-type cytochrome [Thiohalobacter sp. IOR34]WJW75583.1 c-type cytochrome [Thiohalobacter sp. IOR34]